jgi:hypothetical protein
VDILLMVIGGYEWFIILVVIADYYVNGHWWIFC